MFIKKKGGGEEKERGQFSVLKYFFFLRYFIELLNFFALVATFLLLLLSGGQAEARQGDDRMRSYRELCQKRTLLSISVKRQRKEEA